MTALKVTAIAGALVLAAAVMQPKPAEANAGAWIGGIAIGIAAAHVFHNHYYHGYPRRAHRKRYYRQRRGGCHYGHSGYWHCH